MEEKGRAKLMEISKKYNIEIRKVFEIIDKLEHGRYLEHSGAPMDGGLNFNLEKLKENVNDLLTKVENGLPSETERMSEALSKIKF
jgi:hypothetical protein